MNVFISVPMHGRSDDEILEDILSAREVINRIFSKEKPYILHNLKPKAFENPLRTYYCNTHLQDLDDCDLVYFCPGSENAKGCLVEHYICELYGIQRIEA